MVVICFEYSTRSTNYVGESKLLRPMIWCIVITSRHIHANYTGPCSIGDKREENYHIFPTAWFWICYALWILERRRLNILGLWIDHVFYYRNVIDKTTNFIFRPLTYQRAQVLPPVASPDPTAGLAFFCLNTLPWCRSLRQHMTMTTASTTVTTTTATINPQRHDDLFWKDSCVTAL